MRKLIGLSVLSLLWITPSVAQALGECPDGAPSCVVVTMTPEEVRSLVGPGLIFDQAEWANRSGMNGLVQQWKQKLTAAPQGTVKKVEPPKEPVKK